MLRKVIGNLMMETDLINIQRKIAKKPQDMLTQLSKLQGKEKPSGDIQIAQNKEEDILINPEHLVATLPYSLYNRGNEKVIGWEPLEINQKLQELIYSLDGIEMYNTHKIGVVYISPDSIFSSD